MAKLQTLSNFLRRPRYLRAIPSLMVLTTAMAWGVMPDADLPEDALRRSDVSESRRDASPATPTLLLPAPGSRG